MFRFKLNLFFLNPEDTGSGNGKIIQDKELTIQDQIDFLGEENEENEEVLDLKEPKKETPKGEKEEKESDEEEEEESDKTDESDEDDELSELEDEEDEPEEDLDLVVPARKKEILAKYPTLFKDFPYLERAYYREQQFTQLFPSIKEAEEVLEKGKTLDKFETDLIGGNTETILNAVKKTNPDSFNKLVDDYLPTLAKVDENAYHHVLGNVIKDTIVAMVNESKDSDNDVLKTAATILHQFVFGTSKWEPPKKLASEKTQDDTRELELKKKEQEFNKKRFESARDDVSFRIDNTLKSTIEAHIDPKDSMSSFVRKHAVNEAMSNLTSLIEKDTRFNQILDKLWRNAFDNDYSKDSLQKIRSAYLSRAKTLLRPVIQKARNEALKDSKSSRKIDSSGTKRGPIPPGKSTTSNKSGKSAKEQAKQIPHGMKSIDFLMQD